MAQTEVKLNEWISEGFNLYKENMGVLILASLIAILIMSVSVGLLAGPMIAGLVFITLKLYDREEPKPGAGDVFKGFSFFVNAFLFALVWGILFFVGSLILNLVPFLGQIASLAFTFGLQALLMFAMFLIVDQNTPFWEASMTSIEKVKSNLWPFIGFGALAALIGGLGAIACGIGVFLTMPIQTCILAVAYREVFGGVEVYTAGKTAEPVETPPAFGQPGVDSSTTVDPYVSDSDTSDSGGDDR